MKWLIGALIAQGGFGRRLGEAAVGASDPELPVRHFSSLDSMKCQGQDLGLVSAWLT